MARTNSGSSLAGLVSSKRRLQRPPNSRAMPKSRQIALAWPMCLPLGRVAGSGGGEEAGGGGGGAGARGSGVPSGSGGRGGGGNRGGGEEPTEKYQFIRAPRPGRASGRRSGRFSVSVMLVLL